MAGACRHRKALRAARRTRKMLSQWRWASHRRKEHFRMNDRMLAGMAEATRLTRAGRLVEATAMIQRTLAGLSAPSVSVAEPNHTDVPIEAEFHILDDSSPPMEGSGGSVTGG